MPNWIVPQGKLHICKDVPLDNTYQHTLYFPGAGEQVGYFQGKAKFSDANYSYMRLERDVIKVEYTADQLYDCNYIMWQNAGFGTKWFYAFITGIEYINPTTTAIYWELDVMQTWHFSYNLGSCFVEREHAARDEFGDNLVPENLELGEYEVSGWGRPSASKDGLGVPYLKGQTLVLATTSDGANHDFLSGYYAGFPVGCAYFTFDGNSAPPGGFLSLVNQIVEAGKEAAIVSVFLCPTEFVTGNGQAAKIKPFSFSKKDTGVWSGLDIKNKKLYTYPYNMLYVNNMQGQSATYKYEFFTGDATFEMTANMNPNGQAIIYPTNYKGQGKNYDERLSLQINPEVSYSIDSFKSWVAQKGFSFMLGAISAAGSSILPVAANPTPTRVAGAAWNTGTAIANSIAQYHEASIQPPQTHGSITGDSLASAGIMDFMVYNKHITKDMAERIDTYFTMFGYATKKVKVPNRNARASFTYTKTVGCVITGSVPAQDANKICSIYDNGITFWINKTKVGDYTVTNTPTGHEGQ